MRKSPQQRSHPSCKSAPAQPGERGAIAVIAAFVMMFVVLPAMGFLLLTGFIFYSNLQLHNFADSISAAYGLQMLQQPEQAWPSPMFSAGTIAQTHGYATVTPTVVGSQIDHPLQSDLARDRYNPAYVMVDVRAPFAQQSWANWWFRGANPVNFHTTSRRRIDQVSLWENSLYRQPVVLMLDFSSTMRLPYEGPAGNSGEGAYKALQRVATQLIKESSILYDLGVMGFSSKDKLLFPEDTRPGTENDQNSSAAQVFEAEQRHRQMMTDQVNAWVADGDSTNIEDALIQANAALTAVRPTGFAFQKPMVILVTDGEPNESTSTEGMSSSSNLEDLQLAASTDAQREMGSMWNKKDGSIATPVDALVLQIQRQASSGALAGKDTDFLRQIAGSNGVGDSNYFHQDGGDPAQLSLIIQRLPKYIYCQFAAPRNLAGFRSNHAAPPNPATDILRAFVSLPNGYNEVPIPPANIFYKAEDFKKWSSDPSHAAYVVGTDLLTQTISTQFSPFSGQGGTGLDVLINNPDLLAVYYDPESQQATVSGMLCAAMNLSSTNPGGTMTVRLRWGYPQLTELTTQTALGQ